MKHLSLYVGLLCIFGIAAVFFFDAVMGVHETLYVIRRGWRQEIAFDRPHPKYVGAEHGDVLRFSYKISNNRFKGCIISVEVSMFEEEELITKLLSTKKSIEPFQSVEIEWTLETEEFEPNREYILRIKLNEVERTLYMIFHKTAIPKPSN